MVVTGDQVCLQFLSKTAETAVVIVEVLDTLWTSRLHQRFQFFQGNAKFSTGFDGREIVGGCRRRRGALLLLGHVDRRNESSTRRCKGMTDEDVVREVLH